MGCSGWWKNCFHLDPKRLSDESGHKLQLFYWFSYHPNDGMGVAQVLHPVLTPAVAWEVTGKEPEELVGSLLPVGKQK